MNYSIKDVFKKPDVRMIVIIGLMIAFEVVMHRLLGIQTPIVQINFGFVPIIIIAILYGPFYSGLAWGMADVIGTLLFPTGAFFPGFTITAFLSGVIFGIFLFKAKSYITSTVVSVLIVNIFMNMLLNTYWLTVLYQRGFIILLPDRLIKCAITIPVQIIAIYLIQKYRPQLEKTSSVR